MQLKYLPQLILGDTKDFDDDWAAYVKDFNDTVDVDAYIKTINEGLKARRDLW